MGMAVQECVDRKCWKLRKNDGLAKENILESGKQPGNCWETKFLILPNLELLRDLNRSVVGLL